MPILPIDTGRNVSSEMRDIFDDAGKLQRLLDVEAALAWAHAQVGDIPPEDTQRKSCRWLRCNMSSLVESRRLRLR